MNFVLEQIHKRRDPNFSMRLYILKVFFYYIFLAIVSSSFVKANTALSESPMVKETIKDVYIVGGLGAAGGILGLSTLSFYSKPESHLINILYGASIGIIAGVVVVAHSKASVAYEDSAEFSTPARREWNQQQQEKIFSLNSSNLAKDFSFQTIFSF